MAKILVVDDEEILPELLRECLQGEGHVIIICHDSTMAERTILVEKPDLAIIDYRMPGKTGVQLLADLRAREETSRLPVLVVSGTEAVRFTGHIPPEPHVRFLRKPLDIDLLITMVREMLNSNNRSARP